MRSSFSPRQLRMVLSIPSRVDKREGLQPFKESFIPQLDGENNLFVASDGTLVNDVDLASRSPQYQIAVQQRQMQLPVNDIKSNFKCDFTDEQLADAVIPNDWDYNECASVAEGTLRYLSSELKKK